MTALALLLLTAAPLEVRVLEREKPAWARLEAKGVTCDGRPLGASVEVRPGRDGVTVGHDTCVEVRAEGPVTVRLKALSRRYPGLVRVTALGGALRFIDEVDVEDYLPGVVAAELGDGGPSAQAAQAVVSRTFALSQRRRHGAFGYDLCDLAHCQVYRGLEGVSPDVRKAVASTRGEVLLLGGVALKPAFFHAACGGHTSRGEDVFGVDAVGPGVSDVEAGVPLCAALPDFSWRFDVERVRLAAGLGLRDEGAPFEVLRRDAGGRVLELRSFGRRFSGNEYLAAVGRAFGYQSLRSMKASAQVSEGLVHFTGVGLGHGVGLCQQGAKALSEKGVDAKGILQRYFPDAQVRAAP